MANIRKSLKTLVLFVLAVAMIFTNMSIALPVVSAADDTSSETYVTEIKGANMTIGQDLSLNYYATLADEHKDATMHFVMSNGKEVDVKGVYDAKQGVYKFTLNAIPPQTMGDTIDATLKLGDEVLDEHIGYSVKAYAQSQFTKYPNDAELKQLLTDMLYYGEAAQLYRNYETDALVTNDVQGIGTPSDESILPTESGMLNQVDPNTTARFTSAGVWFDYNNRLYIKFNATEGVTVKVNGEAVTFDGAMYNTNGIYAVDFDKVYTFELYEGETLANRIEYSIKAYVYNTMNKKGEDGQLTNMAKLVRALYAYGKSAEAYRDAKPENVIVGDNSATTIVIPTLDNKVSSAVSMFTENGAITAYVPAGVALATDTDTLTLKVNDMADSKAEISLEKTESAFSINVHIDGISANNDVATKITIKELLPVGLNMGNYRFYHVENGETVEMILLADGATPVHNNFEYDPATGDVVLYLTSFSEIALVADTKNAWNGEYDYSWYTNAVAPVDGESVTEYTIANADQLAAFGAIVGGMNGQTQDSFDGKYVKLLADINLGDDEEHNNPDLIFYPIGYYYTENYENKGTVYSTVYPFKGTFDGNGNTISNFYQNTWEMKGDYNDGYPSGSNHYKDAMGLFGYVVNGTIKNLTVDNFSSDGEFTPTGVIAAYADGNSNFENIAITNCNPRVYNTGNGSIIGIAGSTSAANDDHIVLKNITVDNSNKISALWGSWDVACGGLVGMYRGNVNGDGNATGDTINFENCHVAAQIDVYNDVCANYQYYAYRYAGMMIGSIRHNKTENGYSYPNMEGITASDCTVHFGTWNDYYYCELVDNTIASYTHDYQMSRLVEIKAINGTTITYLDDTTGTVPVSGRANYVIVDYTKGHGTDNATCYHFLDGEVWNHEDGGKETTDINGDGNVDSSTLKEDKQHIYLEFNQLFTGYGWGISSKGLTDFEGIENMDITEGDQEESVEKFKSKFTGDFLYRVGNQNAVALGSLFGSADDVTIDMSGFYVSIENIAGNAAGEFTSNATWTNGTIQFTGTGVVKVTIQDYNYCKPTELYLEVVDATNAISKTDVTSKNVVLLNDISGGFTVSNGFSLYGNGFKATCSGDGSYRSAALSYGFVTVETGGTLDNLQIICDIFPESYMYTNEMKAGSDGRYPYGYSAVVINGNSTISNCYIYGARNNILVVEGNVTIKNTVTECGSLSNIQIKSTDACTVTLDDVTTIQYITQSKYDTSKKVMGFGVIVGDNESASNPTIKLLGDLKQYNWVTQTEADTLSNSYAKQAIGSALNVNDYQHTINETVTVNMGIAYLNDKTATITDERENKETIQYKLSSISMLGYTGQVYSITSESSITFESRYDPNTDEVIPYAPNANGYILPTISWNATTSNAITTTNGYNKDQNRPLCEIVFDLDNIEGGSYTFNFNDLSVKKHGVDLSFTVKDSNGNLVDKNANIVLNQLFKEEYTLEITDNMIYGAGAVKEDAKNCSYPVVLQATKTSIEPPKFTNAGTATAIRLVEKTGGDWRPAYTVLTGVSVTYWSASESKVKTVDLSTLYNSGTINSNVWTYTCDDYTLTITGGAVHSDGTTITPVVANDTLYFASTNKAFGTGTTSRSIILTYVFSDKNDSTTWNRTEPVTYSNLDEYDYNSFKNNGTLTKPSSSSGCITPDTFVTLADGTQVRVDSLTGNEELLVWNMETGKLDTAPIMFVDSDPEAEYEIVHLYFSDGTDVKIIYEHGFWDYDLNKYVYLDANASAYIGHTFAKQNGDTLEKVQLVDVVIEKEMTTAWSPVTAHHLCYFVNGMLSMPGGVGGLFNIFDVDADTMTYDYEAMQKDIETYGLYTYEELNAICPLSEEMFNAAGGAYLKISIAKGNLTEDELITMINRYSKFFA